MSSATLSVGYIPLLDAAPLFVAREIGFAEEEGLSLNLRRAPSWSTLRDLVAFGQIEAAHMLAPVPVAMALGLGGMATRLDALMVLSVNGNVVGVNNTLADRISETGYSWDFNDARRAGDALITATSGTVRIGVPFPFSMHTELLNYWMGALGLGAAQTLNVRTVPPPLMADAIAAGEIDAFCVGEPWGSIAVENQVGHLLLPGTSIWSFAPEKVLAVRHSWAEAEPDLTGRLMRAIWRACRWLGSAENRITTAEILARPDALDLPAEVLERALSGHLVIGSKGEQRQISRFIEFHAGAANFPWRSQAAWIGAQLAARTGLDHDAAQAASAKVFRADLFRRILGPAGADLPGASAKLEGAINIPVSAASSGTNEVILQPDRFFDGRIFDPGAI